VRPQGWAFLGVIGGPLAAAVALLAGRPGWAAAAVLATVASAVAARRWSVRHPGPMSHALGWVLRLPRGPHSPARLIRILEPRRGERVLEVGPGIGIHALPIARSIAPEGRLDAVDVQQAMLDDLAARAHDAGVANVTATCADATSLTYPDATFDAIFLVTVLGEIPDGDAALKELRRVIKPSGRLVIGEMLVDPDFIALKDLRRRVERAAFALERRLGPSWGYFARFRPV
jgi:SAM-dependent methyltransferase